VRPIKFRSWDRTKGNWVTCDLWPGYAWTVSNGQHEREAMTEWQQFTGLLDKNGKEIYEGDIVRQTYRKAEGSELGQIIWTKNARFVWYEPSEGEGYGMQEEDSELREVIGNIHENPELLK